MKSSGYNYNMPYVPFSLPHSRVIAFWDFFIRHIGIDLLFQFLIFFLLDITASCHLFLGIHFFFLQSSILQTTVFVFCYLSSFRYDPATAVSFTTMSVVGSLYISQISLFVLLRLNIFLFHLNNFSCIFPYLAPGFHFRISLLALIPFSTIRTYLFLIIVWPLKSSSILRSTCLFLIDLLLLFVSDMYLIFWHPSTQTP